MARTADLSDIKNRVLWRASLPLTTTRIDTAAGGELETWIQEAAAELWEIIVQHFGDDYFFKEDAGATASGVRYVALPTDHYKTIAVWWKPSGATTSLLLDTFPADEEFDREATPYWSSTMVPRYRERESNLYFEPTPDAVYRPVIQYVPTMPVIDSTTNPFPGVMGWDEWIVTKCARWALEKDQVDATHLERELTRQTDRILRSAPRRNIHRKHHIRRTKQARWRTSGSYVRSR